MITWHTGASGAPCVQATTLLVTPPNQTTSLRVPFTEQICDRGALNSTPWIAHPLN